jgi:hypothetical protein
MSARRCVGVRCASTMTGGFGQAELARRQDAAVARDDDAVVSHEHGVNKAEFGDGPCDLRHLLLGVRPGVPGMRDQAVERPAPIWLGVLGCMGMLEGLHEFQISQKILASNQAMRMKIIKRSEANPIAAPSISAQVFSLLALANLYLVRRTLASA